MDKHKVKINESKFNGIVTGFHVTDGCIDCMCGKNLIKIDKYSQEIVFQRSVFEKEGLSRKLMEYDNRIFVYDFCTLYQLNQKNYDLIGEWKLDHDLSSDICGMAVGDNTIYCSIRSRVYEIYLHTLCNLTITGHNSELGTKSFNDKKNIIRDNSKANMAETSHRI